jgi:predicted dehydrogenase
MVDAARGAGRFLMEAMWSRFLPSYRRLRSVLDEGAIGEPLMVEADFGFRAPVDPAHRLFDPAQGGGALLDLGVYPLQLSAFVLGIPLRVVADASVGTTGVDESVAAVLHHPGERLGVIKASTRVPMACTGRIAGTTGWIELPPFMHCPTSLTVRGLGGSTTIDAGWEGEGLRFEIEEVHRCLSAGETESATMPLAESVALMRVLDSIRAQVGVSYPSGRIE